MKIKKLLFIIIWIFSFAICFVSASAPSFDKNFAKYLTDSTPDEEGRIETVFSICIDKDKTIKENIRNLFFPNQIKPTDNCGSSAGWQFRDLVRTLGFVILFLFLVMTWVKLILSAKDSAETKKAISGLIYIWYWAFLLFGATWILGSVLNIETIQNSWDLVDKVQNWLFFQILSFFKILAFFIAIVMIAFYGFKMMSAMDQSDKTKAAKTWIVNVIIALVFIKIIDYVFYIAKASDFALRAKEVILDLSKFLWYALWATFVITLIYAGFLMITSWWKEDTFKKARWYIVNILISAVVIFLFLLILYQIFSEFTW